MSAKTKKRSAAGTVDSNGLKRLRWDFDQIHRSNEDYERFQDMDNADLSKLVNDSELIAMKARYALWRRHELHHQGN